MAGLKFTANSGEVSVNASTTKSLLQIKAPANQRVHITALKVFGKAAAGGTDTQIRVKVTRSTANFGTFSGGTTGKMNPSNPETLQTTVGANASAEPTSPTDSGQGLEFNPQTGVIEFRPGSSPLEIPGGQAINIEVTTGSGSTQTVMVIAECEE